jgi:hypothetical protein
MLAETHPISTASYRDLVPSDPLGQRLTAIFSHGYGFIYRKEADQHWLTEKRYPIQPRNLWAYWQDVSSLIGVRFGGDTTYGLIDIDIHSLYHPDSDPSALPKLRSALAEIGICRTLLIRSSESRGLHLYICLPEQVVTFGLALALRDCVESAGFAIAAGQLEIFPNVKSFSQTDKTNYNGHRLPLQTGSYLLDDDCEIITDDLEFFLNAWELAASGNDIDELNEAIALATKANKIVAFRRGERDPALWRADSERIISVGWTANGQTNELLKVVACYGRVFKELDGQELIDYTLETAINATGYAQHCKHHRDIKRRARDWSIAVEKRYFPLSRSLVGRIPRDEKPDQRLALNQQRSNEAIERIKFAFLALKKLGFTTVRDLASAIAAIAKCSVSTLYKHLSEWHPKHNGCNTQDEPTEPISDVETPIEEIHPKTLEPAPSGLLHPNAYKKVLDRVTPKILLRKLKKQLYKLPSMPPGFDFSEQTHKKTLWKSVPGRVSQLFRLIYWSGSP